MRTRIISGLIGVILLLGAVMTGGIVLKISVLVITLIGIKEFRRAFSKVNIKLTKYLYLYSILLFVFSILNNYNLVTFSIVLNLIIFLIIYVFNSDYNINEICISVFASLYIPFSLVHISFLEGNILIWLIFIIAFSTDTFAYFSGNFFGKRKLAPILSPKKTIEGAIGGLIGALISTIIFVEIFNLDNIFLYAALGVISSIASVIGDLTASKIKRNIGIKDYGNIMPGHGGVLDRFDSILFISPLIFYFISYLI
ncbi:phosphatidate cytidylyltransferase [Clostridium sp. D2Q-11]|uniref:Phosphatidate cytidylyltransferase n=1 Tax=Anaeromonas frigoriresistens TaxID=2683708 RepID=A0A942V0Z5_9FIRM|nr:phosphatidate cytidylyltransferase [Anaeromonas frigoriresistens]MBS4539881.1 phosphatidate cytidylyltransferase [Anaeromonas frigoriresistens]